MSRAKMHTNSRQSGRRLLLKKTADRVLAAIALAVLAPLLLLTGTVILLTMGHSVLFRQVRPGRLGRPFMLYKFRTMSLATDPSGKLLPDSERLTRLGKLIRTTSLDELPQLWNVLRGDISLVGPRPLLMQYLPRYSREQARRQDVMPGITGWAQINGRNALMWDEKFVLDTWYVDHWSLGLDLRILLLTFKRVLMRDGTSNGEHASMPEFMGNDGAVE
jgi:sugar transferase EpsL